MTRCSICNHPRRSEIDQQIAAGMSLRAIAREFATTHPALSRHRAHSNPGVPSVPTAHVPPIPGVPAVPLVPLPQAEILPPDQSPQADPTTAPSAQSQSAPGIPARRRGPPCSTCSHPQRQAIDAALVAGATTYAIADQYGLSQPAVHRHATTHIAASLVHAAQVQEVAHASGLLAQIQNLQAEAAALLERAKTAGDIRAAAVVLGQQGKFIELLSKVESELPPDDATINVVTNPEWARIRSAMMAALEPFPEARQAVADALAALP